VRDGADTRRGVVDERLRIHRTRYLRVVYANFFPSQVKGNLASVVYAVAERAAGFVKEELTE